MIKKHSLSKKIINAIQKIAKKKKVFLHEPFFIAKEKNYLNLCISKNSVSTKGFFTNKFEKKIKSLTKAKYVILTNTGTSALHLALIGVGVRKNQEVLMPSFNYIASANATLYCNAIPHFIDINKSTLAVDSEKLDSYLSGILIKRRKYYINKRTKRRIGALICLHVFGHSAQIDKIRNVCKKYKIPLVEDAAEALGSLYKNKHLGTFGLAGVLSFNGNKIVTSGCGGAIITNNKNIATRLLHLSKISKIPHKFKYNYDEIGYNYQMPNLNAALGYGQIEKINYFIKQKRNLFIKYKKAFANIEEVKLFEEPKNSKSNYWLQTLILKKRNRTLRDYILKKLNINGLGSRPIWNPLHKINYLTKYPKSKLDITMEMNDRIINIPSSAFL
jgi:aminotransferase in exopolysaccharide biosynthesis